jgi:hypothetical protein
MTMRSCSKRGTAGLWAAILLAVTAGAVPIAFEQTATQGRDCNRPFADAITTFDLPAFEAVMSSDGCWIFTLYVDRQSPPMGTGLAVLRRTDSGFELHRAIPMPIPRPAGPKGPAIVGLALTRDGNLLVLSHDRLLSFFDVARLKSDAADPLLGRIESPRLAQSWGVVVSADDKYAFAAQRVTSSVVMVDLDKVRQGVFDQSAIAGVIPTAQGATMPVISRDGRYLFAPTIKSPDVLEAALACEGGKSAEGSIQVVDVQQARTAPGSATVGFATPAGCQPIWAALSPDGTRLSAAAPGPISPSLTFAAAESSVTVFDARPLREGKPPMRIGKIPVGAGPVRVLDSGDKLLVSFGPASDGKTVRLANVVVIDPSKASLGAAAIMGTLPFPLGSMALSPDGRTVFGPNGKGLTLIDLQRVTLEPVK